MKLRLILLLLLVSMLLLFSAYMARADCLLNCLFQANTTCIDNNCVPNVTPPTPSPIHSTAPLNEIRLTSAPGESVKPVVIDCASLNLQTVKVFLVRSAPPPAASFYSLITSGPMIFMAQKDILNRYAFMHIGGGVLKPQFVGLDFMFNTWENPAFGEVLRTLSCAEMKRMGLTFNFGVSIRGDWSDIESATFTFK